MFKVITKIADTPSLTKVRSCMGFLTKPNHMLSGKMSCNTVGAWKNGKKMTRFDGH